MKSPSQSRQSKMGTWLRAFLSATPVRFAVIVICFLWSLPTVGMLISSFRPEADINSSGWWTVFAHPFEFTQWTLANYQGVTSTLGLGQAFLNTLLVTIPSVVIPITIAAFAAYAFAWLEFPGKNILFAMVIVVMVVPLHTALIPILRLYRVADLNGTYLGIWLAHTGFGLPLAIYLLYGYISTIPREIMESAVIDGASPFTAFTGMILPLSIPAIASFAIFQFLWVWNDLLVALVFLGTSRETRVMTSHMTELVGSKGQDWEILTAGGFIMMIVPLIVFFSLQRYFIRGLLAGSVKG
ncbi:MAG TPA: sugar ABC transporter permease [Anaerolineae bacterium]|nr:sugar ABC transporter permease [Anaerolineae bacterium]